jgi:tRNA (guanine37-N1)-methyltransferase
MFTGPMDESIIRRARETGLLDLRITNLRDFSYDRHKTVDDRPFGGGPGMVLKPEPIFESVESIEGDDKYVILLSASGRLFNQSVAEELAKKDHIVFICGGYEGVDERVAEHLANDEISIGDFVLTNGALPAMVIIDAVTRLLPGALGDSESSKEESFSYGFLEYPHYTRPADFRGWKAPEVLLSGNHAEIAKWRQQRSLERTMERRPDLYKKYLEKKKLESL